MNRYYALALFLGFSAPAAAGTVPVDGDLDPTFQDDGTFTFQTPSEGGQAVAVAADGRLLVGYTAYLSGSDTDMRLLPVPDDGITTYCGSYAPDQGGTNADKISDILPIGGVVYLAGTAAGPPGDPDPVVAIGAVDLAGCQLTGFGGADGAIFTSSSPLESPHVTPTLAGTLRVAAQRGAGAARELRSFGVNAAGNIDGAFALGAVDFEVAYGASFFEPHDMVRHPNGTLVVVGTVEMPDGDRDVGIVRLEADGDLDSTFSLDGLLSFSYAVVDSGDDEGRAVGLLADGRIVVGGSVAAKAAIAVITPTGGFDNDFGVVGRYTFTFETGVFPSSSVRALAIQGDSKIVAAGGHADAGLFGDMGIARLFATGDAPLDPSFHGDGRRTLAFNLGGFAADAATAVTLGQGGKISVVGFAEDDISRSVVVARFWNAYIFADGFEWGQLLETEWRLPEVSD